MSSKRGRCLTTDVLEAPSERFNRTIQVRCADRRFANAFVDARMMEWLLALPSGWGLGRIPSVDHSLYPPRPSPIEPRPDALP